MTYASLMLPILIGDPSLCSTLQKHVSSSRWVAERNRRDGQRSVVASVSSAIRPLRSLSLATAFTMLHITARSRRRQQLPSSVTSVARAKPSQFEDAEASKVRDLPRRAALTAFAPLQAAASSPAVASPTLSKSASVDVSPTLSKSVPYVVSADGSLPPETRAPKLQKISVDAALQDVGGPEVRAVFLGEHHNSQKDHDLQAAIIRALAERRPVAVGLEAIQRRFQPVLDAYVRGELTDEDLEAKTEWRTRWFWPFDRYLPVFRTCKQLQLPLVALNVDSEDLSCVEVGGLPGIDKAVLQSYVPNPQAFSQSVRTGAFKAYENRIIKSSYDMHKEMGILRKTITGQTLTEDMTYRNFLSGRLLWDNGMGSRAAAWLDQARPESLLIGLIGADHVKFGCGVPARCAQMLGSLNAVRGIMLNTNPQDTHQEDYGEADVLTLQMPFAAPGQEVEGAIAAKQTKGLPVLPLADLVWYSA